MKGSVDPQERNRASLVERLQKISNERQDIKIKISEALARRSHSTAAGLQKRAAAGLQKRERTLIEDALAIQAQLSEIKKETSAKKAAEHNTLMNRFYEAAKRYLNPDEFEAIIRECDDEDAA